MPCSLIVKRLIHPRIIITCAIGYLHRIYYISTYVDGGADVNDSKLKGHCTISHSLLPIRRFGVYKKNELHPRFDLVRFMMTNMIIDVIIYFKERNSYFFVPLYNGWHYTTVNTQPPSSNAPFVLPLWEVSFAISRLGTTLSDPTTTHRWNSPESP